GAPYLAVCTDAAGPDTDHHEVIEAGLNQVLDGKLATFVRTYTATCGREERPSQVMISALPTGGAVVVHQALGPASDSGRWRVNQARERDETMPRLAEHAPVLMWTSDGEGAWRWFNRRWLDFTGQTLDDAVREDWRTRIHRDDRVKAMTTANEAQRNKREYLHKYRLRRPDGEYRWLHERGQPLYHPDGRFAGYIGSCTDITDIVRTEEDLARNRDHLHRQLQFAGTLNRMAQTIIAMDDQDRILDSLVETIGRTLAVDHALIIDVRLPQQKAVVLSDWGDPSCPVEIQHKNDLTLDQFQESLRHAWEMRTPLESHHDQINPRLASEGSASFLHQRLKIRSVLWYPFAFRADGFLLLSVNQLVRRRIWLGDEREFLAAVTNLVNLALQKARMLGERRESAVQRHQTSKMEAMGRLAGGVAHDFNNLLTAISGHTHLLLRGLPNQHPLRKHAETVLRATERATETTRNLLAFSRQQPVTPIVTNPNKVVERLRVLIDRLIPANITVETDLLVSAGNVLADPGQLELALMNLAVNARDAMPDGGRMVITTRELVVDDDHSRRVGARPGIYVTLSVRDTGVGMDPGTAERIFEPFFTTKEAGRGTGLGLSSAYGAVRAMDGFITIETAKGRGSTIAISLPKVMDDAHETPTPLRLKALGGSETILLVEDNAAVLELTRDALRNQGYQVLSAGDGDEALRVMQSHPGAIDLLLTDLVLPGFNGQTLAVRLRAVRPNLTVIFSSGYSADAFQPTAEMSNAGFLAKPYTIDELVRAVRSAIDAKH
ncbi:MAG TPA: response regulator, partial [Planctomycetota bacterium]|nr:response regulator [Planctomycetota bacterium]